MPQGARRLEIRRNLCTDGVGAPKAGVGVMASGLASRLSVCVCVPMCMSARLRQGTVFAHPDRSDRETPHAPAGPQRSSKVGQSTETSLTAVGVTSTPPPQLKTFRLARVIHRAGGCRRHDVGGALCYARRTNRGTPPGKCEGVKAVAWKRAYCNIFEPLRPNRARLRKRSPFYHPKAASRPRNPSYFGGPHSFNCGLSSAG